MIENFSKRNENFELNKFLFDELLKLENFKMNIFSKNNKFKLNYYFYECFYDYLRLMSRHEFVLIIKPLFT